MHMLNRRLHLLLDEERYRKLVRRAGRRGISVAAVIREAIDRLPEASEQRAAAVRALLEAEPMPVPEDPRELRHELDDAHNRLAT
jgi:hypothetical protein